jgi:glycosyltransferase involved in cell wall biosynthesis
MPRLTAVVRTHNDGLRLGRCLETLYPCDEILIFDQGSTDQTLRIAREYGARIVQANNGSPAKALATAIESEWLLCISPRESLTEELAASLFEWKSGMLRGKKAFACLLREEVASGWIETREPQTRLVPARCTEWNGFLPANEPSAVQLAGALLRFAFP